MSNHEEIPVIENVQSRQPNVLFRTLATAGLLAGSVGALAALNGGRGEAEGAGSSVAGLEACVDGPEDTEPFEVNSGFLYVPFKEGHVIEAVCVETDTPSVERLELGGSGDANIQLFPTIIVKASVDYEPVENVCDPLDSGKIDVEEDTDVITITAEPGKLITGYCVKAGSIKQGNGPEYVEVEPPVASIEISHSSGKDISHYSFSVTNEYSTTTTTEVEQPTTTTEVEQPTTTTEVEQPTTTTEVEQPTTTTEVEQPTTTTEVEQPTTTTSTTTPTVTTVPRTTVPPRVTLPVPPTE